MNKNTFLFAMFYFIFLSISIAAAEELLKPEPIKIIIMPLAIHSQDNLSAFRRQILNTMASVVETDGISDVVGIERLKKIVLEEKVSLFDETLTSKIGREEGANFAILGSIAKIGRDISIDIRLLDISNDRLISFFYVKAEDEDRAIEAVIDLTRELQKKIKMIGTRIKGHSAGVIDRIIIANNKRVDEDAIRAKIKSKVGEPLVSDDLRDDIKTIYNMGYFEDVMADIADITNNGIELTFIVKEKPLIKKVEIVGNDEITADAINAVISVKENTILDKTLLIENAEKIKALYTADGFYLARVEPVVEKNDDSSANIKFQIEEGDKVKVKRITIIGNKNYDEDEIRKVMDTKETGIFSFITKSGVFDEIVFQSDLDKILTLYYDNGYINAVVTDHLVSLSSDKRWFFITIAITEGEQYTVGKIDIKGDILTNKEDLMEKIKLTTGEIFNKMKLNQDIIRISDIYGDEGYANVDIKPLTTIDPKEKNVMDITLDIEKGALVYIEKINISGNVNTRDKVIRREIELAEGMLFSSTALKRSRNNVRRLGYFDTVNITHQIGSSEDKMVLNIDVKERPTGSLSAGVGYSSVDKIVGTASVSESNFFGTGLKLDISGTISSKSERYQLGFTEPWLFDKPISAGVDIFKVSRDYPDFTRGSYGFDVRFGFPVYERDTRGYLTYKLEEVTVKNVASDADVSTKEQEGKKTTSSISGTLKRDTRDDAFSPTEGSTTSLSVEFAGGILKGDNNFVKYIAEGVKFFPMPWDTVISTHGVIGYVHGFGGKEIPVYERFYLGGINSIRGFSTREVGPRNPETNKIIGGDKEMFVNLEYLFPLIAEQRINGLIFFDAGNAYVGDIDLSDLRTSVGTGIRWFSPVGPLRLEWGYNLDSRPGEKSSQWEFTIGTMF